MDTTSRVVSFASIVAALTLSTVARGEPDDGLLRGPEVPREVAERIGGEDMNGRFVRVEGRPEFAAAAALALSPEVRERIRVIEAARSEAVTMLLVDELDLVRAMSDAIIAGDNERARTLMPELWERLEEGKPHAPCADAVEAALPASKRPAYRRVLEDYWRRWIERAAGAMDGADAMRAMDADRVRDRLAMELFQEEVRAGYERSLRHYRQSMDAIYAAVDPTEEQRATIRTLVIEHIKRTRLEATSDERRAVMIEVYRMLDGERRERFVDYLLRVIVPDGAG